MPQAHPTTTPWIHEATQSRSRRTEHAIRQAALRLLAGKPFEEITVAEIAEAAGVSVGGFYRRFRDKRAVLSLAQHEALDEWLKTLPYSEEWEDVCSFFVYSQR